MAARKGTPGRTRWNEVHEIVRSIPPGHVMNYGQIARLLEPPLSARAVGWAMRECPQDVPWHRVVNASGQCSTDALSHLPKGVQRALLESEGVRFGPDGRIDMNRFRWSAGED